MNERRTSRSHFSLLLTGGAGFIGSAVVRHAVGALGWRVLNVDKLTYAGNPDAVRAVENAPNYSFLQADVCDADAMRDAFRRFQPDAVAHLAAETHVDRSIDGPLAFVRTNVVGTGTLLEVAREYWNELPEPRKSAFRFHQISTDEVYGSLGPTGLFTERSPYAPQNPYSASKASADCLARSYFHTFGLPVLITNSSNNFGPYQFPEKLVPLAIANALERKPIPVYGAGDNIRDWIYVDDHVQALVRVLTRGRPGETYNVGARCERTNLEVVRTICAIMDELAPSPQGSALDLIRFVEDRPGNDRRYAIDPTKIETELGWRPEIGFDAGMRETVAQYLANQAWLRRIRAEKYSGERLGALPPAGR